MLTAPHADPRALAEPRLFIEMQCALGSAEMFRKKANEWDKEHGDGYHLETAVLVVGLLHLFWPLALYFAVKRKNPYRGDANYCYAAYKRMHDDIAKKHGLPTIFELTWRSDTYLRAKYSAARTAILARNMPAQPVHYGNRPASPRATLAA